MIKTLFRKQMLELNRGFFYDSKKGKSKSKSAAAVSILVFAILMIAVIGGIFVYMADMLSPLIEVGMGWMYFLIMGAVAVMLGMFGSVFNTYASLYQAKDNDLILSLPVPVRMILAVRLSGVYLMGAMYSLIVFVPAMIIYYINASVGVSQIVGTVAMALLITIFVLVLSCVLGWVVAKISGRLKNKSFVTVVLSIAFIVLYYFVYFRANEMIMNLLENATKTGDTIKLKAHPLYVIGCAAQGDTKPLLIVSAVVLLLFVATLFVLSRTFLSIATAGSNEKKVVYKEKKVKVKSVHGALFGREMKHFLSSPIYMLNCALGSLFLVIAAAALLWKGYWIENVLVWEIGMSEEWMAVLAMAGICMMSSMNTITAPSISLEGRNLWLVRSLPVTSWQVIRSKLNLHLLLTAVPTLLCSVCACIALRIGLIMGLFVILVPLAYTFLGGAFGLVVNLRNPNLNWTSETAVVKQSFGVIAVMFGGWGLVLIPAAAYLFWLADMMSVYVYVLLWLALYMIIFAIMYRWLRRGGTKILDSL